MTGPMNGLGWITERPRTSGRLRVPDGAGRLLTDIEFLVGRLGRIRSGEMVTQSASETLSLREIIGNKTERLNWWCSFWSSFKSQLKA
jgi:hypothetical protein